MRRSPRKAHEVPVAPVKKRTNSKTPGPATKETHDRRSPADRSIAENLLCLSNLQRQQETRKSGNNHNETPRQPPESRYRLTPPKIVLANFKRKLEEQEIAREKDKTIQKQQEQLRAARVETKAILAQLKVAENEAKARTAALGDSMAQEVAKKERPKVNCTLVYLGSVVFLS